MGNAVEVVMPLPVAAVDTPVLPLLRTRLPIPELALAFFFVSIGCGLSWGYGLPLSLPSGSSLAFTGMNNLVPTLVVVAGLIITLMTQKVERALYFAAVLVGYGAILIVHFNIKLWVHAINPVLWDEAYMRVDSALYPLITGARTLHDALPAMGGAVNRLYLFAFLAMFGCSIIIHSSRSFPVFRRMILTAMLVHVIGGFSYLIAPALGPFLFDSGVNALEAERQAFMLVAHNAALAGESNWFGAHGSEFLATGLAAMPSLHVASSAVFVYYAWVHERWLGWLYLPLFGFIMIEAIATRWHYLVDIVAGLGLTALAVFIVERILARAFRFDAAS
jgi:PAP2 superfamily